MATVAVAGVSPARRDQVAALVKMQFSLLLRRRALWATTLISLLATLWAYTPVSWLNPPTRQIPANATYYMGQFLAPELGFTCVLCAFLVAGTALEDRRHRIAALLFSRAVSSLVYVISKMSALVMVVLAILALDIALAVLVQPWLAQSSDAAVPKAVVFWPYVEGYLALAVPAALFLVPCAWLLAITTRRVLAVVVPLFLWWAIIFGTPFQFAVDLFTGSSLIPGSRAALGEWFDPTGLAYTREIWAQAFTTHPEAGYLVQRGLIPLSGNFIASRLCFVLLGVVLLFVVAWVIERQRRSGA
jgi:hypothetical protein